MTVLPALSNEENENRKTEDEAANRTKRNCISRICIYVVEALSHPIQCIPMHNEMLNR